MTLPGRASTYQVGLLATLMWQPRRREVLLDFSCFPALQLAR